MHEIVVKFFSKISIISTDVTVLIPQNDHELHFNVKCDMKKSKKKI